jgi:hypothetical protein
MFRTKNLKILSFNMNDKKKVLDRFELIIKIDRFFGILFQDNKTFGCVSISYVTYYFLKKGYKLCNSLEVNSKALIISNHCKKICKPKCNFVNFVTKFDFSKHDSNKTVVEVIPKKLPRIAYTETLKTDFNRLVYDCGGILGLWFGLSPIKAWDLLRYIPQINRVLINILLLIVMYSLRFFHFACHSLSLLGLNFISLVLCLRFR